MKLYPGNLTDEYKLLSGDVPDNMTDCFGGNMRTFIHGLKNWYSNNPDRQLDYILNYYHLKETLLEQYCPPINMTCIHWVVLDVTMLNDQLKDRRDVNKSLSRKILAAEEWRFWSH